MENNFKKLEQTKKRYELAIKIISIANIVVALCAVTIVAVKR
jgi:hypothetical protein